MAKVRPKISLVIPVHEMRSKSYFLSRCLNSIKLQSFKDYEICISENGKGMAKNTNEAIKKAKGDIIKVLFMDDYLSHRHSLKKIVNAFNEDVSWLVTGCEHDDGEFIGNPHWAKWGNEIFHGANTIGSPSVMAFKNDSPLLFDENMTWLLDVDLYIRMFERYGIPKILDDINTTIGIGTHQTTHLLTEEQKMQEHYYLKDKLTT